MSFPRRKERKAGRGGVVVTEGPSSRDSRLHPCSSCSLDDSCTPPHLPQKLVLKSFKSSVSLSPIPESYHIHNSVLASLLDGCWAVSMWALGLVGLVVQEPNLSMKNMPCTDLGSRKSHLGTADPLCLPLLQEKAPAGLWTQSISTD